MTSQVSRAEDILPLTLAIADNLDTRLTPITKVHLYKYFTFTLTFANLGTQTADKFDVFVDALLPDGTWLNIVHFTQLDGDGSDGSEVAVMTLGVVASNAVIAIADLAEGVVKDNMVPFVSVSTRVVVTKTAGVDEVADLTVKMLASRDVH